MEPVILIRLAAIEARLAEIESQIAPRTGPAAVDVPSHTVSETTPLLVDKRTACAMLGGISDVTIWRLESRGLIQSAPGLRHKLYNVESLKRFAAGKGE